MFVPKVILFLKYLFACHECLLGLNVNILKSKQKPYFFSSCWFFFPAERKTLQEEALISSRLESRLGAMRI